MSKIFIDDIGEIVEINGVVRIDLHEYSRSEDGSAEVRIKNSGELLIPLPVFLNAADNFQKAATNMKTEIEKVINQEKSVNGNSSPDTKSSVVVEE